MAFIDGALENRDQGVAGYGSQEFLPPSSGKSLVKNECLMFILKILRSELYCCEGSNYSAKDFVLSFATSNISTYLQYILRISSRLNLNPFTDLTNIESQI